MSPASAPLADDGALGRWPGPLDDVTVSPLLVMVEEIAWSTCTALDPPRADVDDVGIEDTCSAAAPYVAHLRPLPGDAQFEECHVWLCSEHAARFRADPLAVRRLISLRTTGSPHRQEHRP